MQIAVYSGSFDPLHLGHLAILRQLVDRFDAVYLVVSPQNPLKSEDKASGALRRLRAAREAVARHPELDGKVTVDDIEFSLGLPSYTIDTLDALQRREPDNSFCLVMGADSLASFRRWKDYSRILLDYSVLVFPRRDTDLDAVASSLLSENPSYRIERIEAPLVDLSSTLLRGLLAEGEDASAYLM